MFVLALSRMEKTHNRSGRPHSLKSAEKADRDDVLRERARYAPDGVPGDPGEEDVFMAVQVA
jgi:hypothetical protein